MRTKAMKIQHVHVSDLPEDKVAVELRISDTKEIEDSTEFVVASVRLPNPGQNGSLGKLQLDAIEELRRLVDQAAVDIERHIRAQH